MRAPIPNKALRLIPLLATEHVGELVNARDALLRALSADGLDLHDLAHACIAAEPTNTASAPDAGSTYRPRRTASFGDIARACRDLDRGRLAPRERIFVANMVRQGFAFQPSSSQAAWLDDILARLQGRAA